MADNVQDEMTEPAAETVSQQPPPITEPVVFAAADDTKADIRLKVWDYLDKNNYSTFPRPIKNRIPNFKGSAVACDKVTEMNEFKEASTIKINPDKPQEQARFKTLEAGKTLLVPTPRLRKGLFNRITPQDTKKPTLRFCSTSQGVKQSSTPVGLEMKVKVDLIVIGSVAVSKDGWRIGKGEGYADLEYGMMAAVGAVDQNTIVVTTVHDCQVMDLPDEIFGPHDVTIDYICTPTRVIECSKRPKPTGIIWSLLTAEKFAQIPILRILREQEREAGKDVTLADAVSEEEITEALAKAAQQQEEYDEREASGEQRQQRRNRRPRFKRRGRRSETEGENEGEESPEAKVRNRPNKPRSPRNNRRRRNRDSERLNSEGEPMSAGEPGAGDGEAGYQRRRRRPRRYRRRTNTTGDDNTEQEEGQSMEEGGRRPPLQRRNRNRRRSEGEHSGEDEEGRNKPRRRPRRYQPRRSPRHDGDGNPIGESDGMDSPPDRRQRMRRNNNLPTIYVGSLPKALRVSVFKKQVRDMDVNPLRVLWRGSNGHVFLIFETMEETEAALQKLENLSVNDKVVKVAMALRTERRRRGESGDQRDLGDKLAAVTITDGHDDESQTAL